MQSTSDVTRANLVKSDLAIIAFSPDEEVKEWVSFWVFWAEKAREFERDTVDKVP